MDGRRRLAEPVTESAAARPATGLAPASRRSRARSGLSLGSARFGRFLRRWVGPVQSWQVPRGTGIAAFSVFVLATVGFGVVRGDHVPAIIDELRDWRDAAANAAGFRITSIAMAGQKQLSREEILTTAGITGRTSLLFLDAAEARAKLKANPWIAEATILKLYPSRLHVAVTEREAFALWQKDGKVSVISSDGTVVEPFVSARFAKLPLVVGIGAETKARDFLALLERYPLLRGQMHAAVFVAERRWNVVLKNGIDVRLPETDAAKALDTLVQLDRDNKLLSRDITVVDLRLADRVTVRLADEPAAARIEAIKAKNKKKGGAA
ncbi:MAG: cell division protein FtsQ/DivIB [Xanthobacteraceae bacterium]|nr:cell division protein FtsQ/DivIB [Xanthobacteraceae bacterium]